ncbi:MAG: alpha/beta hydrolase [Sphingomonadaceae bacterium]|nr:alpha/beta hydrolase [Sphingomonadaceae bacterium]
MTAEAEPNPPAPVAPPPIAPPIVLIHGMWSTPAAFAGLRRRLEAAGYTTHAPALPFHDRAPDAPPPAELGALGLEDYIAFLANEIAALPGPVIVAGHSLGGFLAQAVAARVGAAGLMLFAPAATAATSVPGLAPLRTMARVVTRNGWWRQPTKIDAASARWGIYNEVPAEIAEAEIAALVWDSGRVLYEMALPFLAKAPAFAVDYARLTMPALVVVGGRDRITPAAIARATARRLVQVDYEELPHVGHWLWWGEVEARVGEVAVAWLARHFPPTLWDAP